MSVAVLHHVSILEWPDDADRRAGLRGAGIARFWLVHDGQDPPRDLDALEDWARAGADAIEVHSRVAQLAARVAARDGRNPRLGEDGILRLGDAWVALSALECRVVAPLVARAGELIGRAELVAAGWGHPTYAHALDTLLLRLRRHLAPLGLRIQTVRGRGFVLVAPPV